MNVRLVYFSGFFFRLHSVNHMLYIMTDICSTCQHKISSHNHKFWVEGDYQEYEMECLLCGTGEDSISILPIDPRKMSGLLM